LSPKKKKRTNDDGKKNVRNITVRKKKKKGPFLAGEGSLAKKGARKELEKEKRKGGVLFN